MIINTGGYMTDGEDNTPTDQSYPEDYPFWLKPPYRLLTDVTQFRKVDPWDLEISDLIGKFVEEMKSEEDFNFPILGRAILSAAILYRTKVTDLIKIIEASEQDDEELQALQFDIPEITPSYHISQRPVTFNELVFAFKGLLKQEVKYKQRMALKRKKALIKPLELPPEPIQVVDEESTKIAKLKKETYKQLVKLHTKYKRPINFKELIQPNSSKVTIVRLFLCLLFLCFELKAKIFQEKDLGEITYVPIRDEEEEFLGGLEQVIEQKLREEHDEKIDDDATVSEVDFDEEDIFDEENELFDKAERENDEKRDIYSFDFDEETDWED
jgi:chromatin segregation and condensation protein Rec8/ScpA/Scc1 (kleisin family)